MKKILWLILITALGSCASNTGNSFGGKPQGPAASGDKLTSRDEEKKLNQEGISLAQPGSPTTTPTIKPDGTPPKTNPSSTTGTTGSTSKPPAESGLRAGFSDDNREYNYFLSFLDKYKQVRHRDLPVHERLILRFSDSEGKAASLTQVKLRMGAHQETGLASGDGTYLFFPSEYPGADQTIALEASFQGKTLTRSIQRSGTREVKISFPAPRKVVPNLPVDVVFILDTTGSMDEEISRLKATLEIIHLNLSTLPSKPVVRFGMVLYKDKGEDEQYRTKKVPLTSDLDTFQKQLDLVRADGGGDTPEDLVQALDEAVNTLDWTPNGAKLAFIITDAPPQDYPDAPRSYTDLAKKAKEKAIRVFTVGTGSLPLEGEYVLRQIAQYTYAKYIFLTYGEKGESDGGEIGSVSHHTGSNFTTDKLESIIIRFAREEITAFTGVKDPEPEDYFQAQRLASEDREKTLMNLFGQALEQLVSYSTWKITDQTPVAVLPLGTSQKNLAPQAEYFTQQFLLKAAQQPGLKLVDRQDLGKLLQEQELQLTALVDESKAPAIGKILGAQAVVTGALFEKTDYYEVFLKLLRVETGEILALTKARLDKKLGL